MRISLIVLALLSFSGLGQLEIRGPFPSLINESSGLEYVCGNLYSHNDSGDTTRLFVMDSYGNLKEEIILPKVYHIDWEDLTFDPINEQLYIGDFGSNNFLFERKERVLHRFSLPKNDSPQFSGSITFEFEDYASTTDHSNFDCEAMLCLDQQLFLFTKNHSSTGFSKIYSLNMQDSTQTALLLDSIYTNHSVTAADTYLNQVVLLTKYELIMLTYENGGFTYSHRESIVHRQYEGICYLDKNTLLISSENANALYSYRMDGSDEKTEHIYVPSDDQLAIQSPQDIGPLEKVRIYSSNGHLVQEHTVGCCQSEILLNTDRLAKGMFIVSIQGAGGEKSEKIVVP